MRTKAIFAATLLAWVPLPIVAQDFDAGIRVAEDGDYAAAMLDGCHWRKMVMRKLSIWLA